MTKKDQKDNKKKITKDMTFAEVLQMYPQSGEIMQQMGLHCVGCVAASGETLKQGCEMHGTKVEELIEKIEGLRN